MRNLEDNIRREIEGYISAGMSLDVAVDHVHRNRQGRLGMMIDTVHSAIAASLAVQGQPSTSLSRVPTFSGHHILGM